MKYIYQISFLLLSLFASINVIASEPYIPVPLAPESGFTLISKNYPVFKWKESETALEYDFYIYDRSTLKITLRKRLLKSNICSQGICTYQPIEKSKLHINNNHVWRVAAINNDGWSEFSYSLLHVKGTKQPQVLSPKSGVTQHSNVNTEYQWLESDNTLTYNFYIYNRVTSSVALNRVLVAKDICTAGICHYKPLSPITLPDGNNHVWRVAAINDFSWSNYSYSTFNIKRIPIPKSFNPKSGITLQKSQGLTYQWQESLNATSYDFYIYDRILKRAIHRIELIAPNICTKGLCSYKPTTSINLLESKNHVWRVAAINSTGISEYSYSTINIDSSILPKECNKSMKLLDFDYCINTDSFRVDNLDVNNILQITSSQNNENTIFTKTELNQQPQIYIKNINNNNPIKVTLSNNFMFDPVINNNGDYAYAIHSDGVSESLVVFNKKPLNLLGGLHKSLVINNHWLVMHQLRNDKSNWLVKYNIDNKSITYQPINLSINKLRLDSSDSIIIEGMNTQTFRNEVLSYDLSTNNYTEIYTFDGSRDCFLDYKQISKNQPLRCFSSLQVKEKLLFLAEKTIFQNDPSSSLACTNNSLARLTWGSSYRLQSLILLQELGTDSGYPVKHFINKSINCLLSNAQQSTSAFGWPTDKYSLSKHQLSFKGNNAFILYPLLIAANKNYVDEITKQKIIDLAIRFISLAETDYNSETAHYHFARDIDYWADGLWLPYNLQNTIGLVLLELYKSTGIEQYKTQVLQLRDSFLSEWEIGPNNHLIWKYWPQEFYDGWTEQDNYSTNTPIRPPSNDDLYEDIYHAGLNVKFIMETDKEFNLPEHSSHILSFKNILQDFQKNDMYSLYISGNTSYISASRNYIPHYGWPELGNTLLSKNISTGLPNNWPFFNGDAANTYLQALKGYLD